MELTSPAFSEGEAIPRQYTCDGVNISPPLIWRGVPQKTLSLALICDDPDAPVGIWVHWVVYNIPVSVGELQEFFPHDKELPNGIRQGLTDFKTVGYGGPCPPSGTHRYFFTLYALDTKLAISPGLTKAQVLEKMKGHVLAETQLMGTYARHK